MKQRWTEHDKRAQRETPLRATTIPSRRWSGPEAGEWTDDHCDMCGRIAPHLNHVESTQSDVCDSCYTMTNL